VLILTTLQVPSLVTNKLFPFTSRHVSRKLVNEYGASPQGFDLLLTILKSQPLMKDLSLRGTAYNNGFGYIRPRY
jgi:hypothetical protein